MPILTCMTVPPIIAATDGSCLGVGRGPAGWAWVIDSEQWEAGGVRQGTAHLAEMLAILHLLDATPADRPLIVLSDSMSAIRACTKGRFLWRRRDWVAPTNKKVADLSVLRAVDEHLRERDVTFQWVRGHNGHPLNEFADMLCMEAALVVKHGDGLGPMGPSFAVA